MENDIVNINDIKNLEVFLLTIEIRDNNTRETIMELIGKVARGEIQISYNELLAMITAIKDEFEPKNIIYPDFTKPRVP